MKIISVFPFAMSIAFHCTASAEKIDISNSIDRPNCSIEVNVKLVDTKTPLAAAAHSVGFRRLPTEVQIIFNQKPVDLPSGFSEVFFDASRVIPLRGASSCGFQVERGDAAASNRLSVFFSDGKIKKVERFDLKGRITSTTTFRYPGPVVLD